MTDRYQAFARTGVGKLLVTRLGLPDPVPLERWTVGSPLVAGPVLTGGTGRLAGAVQASLTRLGISPIETPAETPGETPAERFDESGRVQALVLDATEITDSPQLARLPELTTPWMRRLARCARLVVLGTPPELVTGAERVAQRALEGFTRSVAKEIGRGGTVQLVYVAPGAEDALDSTLAFLLSPKSAYVSGQVIRLGVTGPTEAPASGEPAGDAARPLANRLAVVTGAARGIGAEISRVLARDGARVLGVDVPAAAHDLKTLADEVDGDFLVLDITHADAPHRLAHRVGERYGGLHAVVHNAGITRDRRLANMSADRWDPVVAVNLTAPERLTRALLDAEVVEPNGRIVGVSSIAGIAGNLGQTNYATSKAGVIGLVDSLAGELAERGTGITVNAVAPGFIETAMTAVVPVATREVGRRLNSLSQGGLPVDVAETVTWLVHPGSTAVHGNVVRVCGQMMLGA